MNIKEGRLKEALKANKKHPIQKNLLVEKRPLKANTKNKVLINNKTDFASINYLTKDLLLTSSSLFFSLGCIVIIYWVLS